MIRSYYGLSSDPFSFDNIELLAHQRDILEVLYVHCQQGGFCLVLGEAGTGKSVVREELKKRDPRLDPPNRPPADTDRMTVPPVQEAATEGSD